MSAIIEIQPESILGNPANLNSRIANHQGIRFNILRDDCTGADKGIFPDIITTDDGRVGANGGTVFHGSCSVFISPVDMTSRVDHIGKDAGRAKEYIILANYTGVKGYVVLNLDVVSEHNAG